ncbi:unnamed protein product [Linum tenue]|uniref:SWIM-type domain-containing protein n=1 Tax=Linum tenue TaxID=586396 RepID=A0AAV0KUP4_9ROSI|nr:unnamed protein product [Linum tenue]
MLEGIRGYMMDRVLIKYRMLGEYADVLCPRIRKRVEKEKEFARLCVARQTMFAKCEVKMGADGYIVDLLGCTCTCGYWALSGLPCCHAVSAITHCRLEVEDYVHPFYHKSTVTRAYKHGIPCLDGRQAWPEASGYPVHPPKSRSMPGRPKKNRRKAAIEFETRVTGNGQELTKKGTIIHCGKCGGEGHNARSCKEPVAARQVAREPVAARQVAREPAAAQPMVNTRSRVKRTAPQAAGNTQGQKRGSHCSKCGSPTHNARTCPLNRANGIQDVRLNVADRRTIERELRVATTGVGVYVDERTGNQYVRVSIRSLLVNTSTACCIPFQRPTI